MIPGNCLVCVFVLWLIHGGKIVMSNRPGSRIPHWLLKSKDGVIRHFKLHRDILPKPFCYLIFLGKFEARRNAA